MTKKTQIWRSECTLTRGGDALWFLAGTLSGWRSPIFETRRDALQYALAHRVQICAERDATTGISTEGEIDPAVELARPELGEIVATLNAQGLLYTPTMNGGFISPPNDASVAVYTDGLALGPDGLRAPLPAWAPPILALIARRARPRDFFAAANETGRIAR